MQEMRSCPGCGSVVEAGVQFCTRCGMRLQEEARPEVEVGRMFPASASASLVDAPMGIVFCVVWSFFNGLLWLLMGGIYALMSAMVTQLPRPFGELQEVGHEAAVMGIVGVLLMFAGALQVTGAIGLWRLRWWGAQLTVWLQGIGAVVGLILMLAVVSQSQGGGALVWGWLLEFLIAMGVIIYLLQPSVQQWLRR